LKRVVEQAVRPVRATIARKRQMREELLAHLTAIFAEETEKLGDDQAALEQAKRRFGDPKELIGPLQEAVPRWNRLARLGDVGQRWSGESLWHYAGRIAIFTLIMLAAAMPIVLTFTLVCGRPSELAIRVRVLFCISILDILLMVGFLLLIEGMYRALYREPSGRSWRLATVYGLLSMAFFPVLAFVWYWSLTGDFATSCTHFGFACRFAPLAPVLFALMARQTAETWRYYEEWASLQIDE
jgi:hypothetical protein